MNGGAAARSATSTSSATREKYQRCLAIHDFAGEEESNDLSFSAGAFLVATDTSDDWWQGYIEIEGEPMPPTSQHGSFPRNYVKVVDEA